MTSAGIRKTKSPLYISRIMLIAEDFPSLSSSIIKRILLSFSANRLTTSGVESVQPEQTTKISLSSLRFCSVRRLVSRCPMFCCSL